LITAGTAVWDPTYATEIVTEHEFGHQYWYGMVATNEFEDAWLDEGINSYTEVNVLAAIFGKDKSLFDHSWGNASDADQQYLSYIGYPDYDPVVRPAWKFRNASSYGEVTYGKSADLLKTLEGIVGRDTMDEAMHVYFMRYRFTHPTTEDFLNTIAEVAVKKGRASGTMTAPAGPELAEPEGAGSVFGILPPGPQFVQQTTLTPYFQQAVYGTRVLDYAVDSVVSSKAEWWKPGKQKTMRSTVTVHRVGDFVLPVTVEVTFSDGSKVRELWAPPMDADSEANSRWHTFTYVKEAEVVSAEIDPDHTVMLDVDHFNDSYTTKSNSLPARKITNLWMSALEGMEQMAGWLV
jgi:hypothetical protein